MIKQDMATRRRIADIGKEKVMESSANAKGHEQYRHDHQGHDFAADVGKPLKDPSAG
ncbi:MAG: hypothetical protein R3E68_03430 [Burkholderiaceae bacterium]